MKKWLVLGAVAAFAVLATGVTANAEMGVGVLWDGGSLIPDMALPISLESGFVITPFAGFVNTEDFYYSYGYSAADLDPPKMTQIRFGAMVEKQTMPGGTTPVFGASFRFHMNSFSDFQVNDEDVDSYFDMVFGLYVGGSASLGDNIDLVGMWGPYIVSSGEQTAGDTILEESKTEIGSAARIMFRWWLWGK